MIILQVAANTLLYRDYFLAVFFGMKYCQFLMGDIWCFFCLIPSKYVQRYGALLWKYHLSYLSSCYFNHQAFVWLPWILYVICAILLFLPQMPTEGIHVSGRSWIINGWVSEPLCVFSLEKGGFAHDLIMINQDLMCYILLLGVADLRWWLDGIIRILALVVGFLVLTSIHNR